MSAMGAAIYAAGRRGQREAYFGREIGLVETEIITRGHLSTEATPGPVIVEEYDTTIVVPPGCSISRDESWNVILSWV